MSGTDDEHALLADQVAYYRARAPEYDRTAYGSDLALARPPVPAEVRLQVVDVLRDDPPWSPTERFDAVLMAFWLSHVPRSQAMPFLDRVGSWLVPGGRLLVVDEPVGADTHERYDDARRRRAARHDRRHHPPAVQGLPRPRGSYRVAVGARLAGRMADGRGLADPADDEGPQLMAEVLRAPMRRSGASRSG
ncbi:MAG TPA: class I SAM-dependent methyltransferase [Actinomycetes bacterium]